MTEQHERTTFVFGMRTRYETRTGIPGRPSCGGQQQATQKGLMRGRIGTTPGVL